MNVYLLGKRWLLRFCRMTGDSFGTCDAPHIPGKQIRIDSKLKDQRQLEVILHELMHAADWTKSEEFITAEARDIARILWRLGYRRGDSGQL